MSTASDSAAVAGAEPPALTSIRDAVRLGAEYLAEVADNPRLEARLLLSHALAVTQNDLLRAPERQVDTTDYRRLLERRRAHEPLAFIVGHREFWSLDFLVSPSTLIPRGDSETVVEAALAAFADRPPPGRILDLGVGTGCLLLALLSEFPRAFGVGVDIEPEAARLARTNAERLGLADRTGFVAANWTDALTGRFDLIVSNPPYIPAGDLPSLMPEVALHEPRRALDGGPDGYDAYRMLLRQLPDLLAPEAVAVLELGAGQADVVVQLAQDAGFGASLRLDLGRIPRAISVCLPD